MTPYQLSQLWNRADWAIPDPGNGGRINPVRSGVCNLKTAGAETRILPLPIAVGQRLVLNMDTDGGDCVVTCSVGATKYAINAAGNNTITFADPMECIELVGVTVGGALRWNVPNLDKAGTDGPSLSTVA